jgi:hypothetical protein
MNKENKETAAATDKKAVTASAVSKNNTPQRRIPGAGAGTAAAVTPPHGYVVRGGGCGGCGGSKNYTNTANSPNYTASKQNNNQTK